MASKTGVSDDECGRRTGADRRTRELPTTHGERRTGRDRRSGRERRSEPR